MKNLAFAIAISVISSGATIAVYELYIRGSQPNVREIVYREQNPAARYASNPYNQRPFAIGGIANVESFVDAANIARPAVVHIQSQASKSDYTDIFGMGQASGSGVIMTEDGYIITNNHVIEGAKDVKVTFNDRRTYTGRVIGTDQSTDLAVVKIKDSELKGRKLPALQWGNSDQIQVGEWVLAVGNPFNLTSTVTAGIVSAKGRNIDILEGLYSVESFIQTDAAVNPGNSGGALVDGRDGSLVGINTAIITRSGRYEGYSFAVPANLVRKVMSDIIEFGEVKRGFLGVTIKDVTTEIADDNNLANLEGVYIDNINKGGAAEEAGLKKGDIITKVNGVRVTASPELQEQVALFRPGNKIPVEYLRGGKTYEAEIMLKNQANTADVPKIAGKRFKSKTNLLDDLGVEAQSLSGDDKKRLKTENGGVLITSIKKGSALERTNMEKGFIITSVNSKKISTVDEFVDAVFDASGEIVLDGFYERYKGEYSYVFEK